jgi:hypothetical protein
MAKMAKTAIENYKEKIEPQDFDLMNLILDAALKLQHYGIEQYQFADVAKYKKTLK